METRCYHPFYCEENIWRLARSSDFKGLKKFVVFISNPGKTCAMWHMRAAGSEKAPVIWDYHVVLAVRHEKWLIWDLDSRLGTPLEPQKYLDESFDEDWPDSYQPRFRAVEAEQFLEHFSSDRSHMIHEGNNQPFEPPPWPAIFNGNYSNLWDYVDMEKPQPGRVFDLDAFRRFLS